MTVPIRIRRFLGQPRLTPFTSEVRLSTMSLVPTERDHVLFAACRACVPCSRPLGSGSKRITAPFGSPHTHHRAALRTT